MTTTAERLGSALSDRYTVERELGAGGMATVYLAHDVKHDRKVALKVLRPELAAVIGAERFLQEIKVTANLQHPHILALYDSGEAEHFLYYVMPFVQGESLDDKLKREKQLGVEEAVRIAGEVASALDYAHRQGVVHRDIKPANIMLQDGQALVADFGIALALTQAGGTRITETGLSLGTPHYMSPEQATGDRDIDARSDIYSLGAVLYESLAGEPPHTGGTIQAVISKVVTETPKPLGELRRSVPVHVGMAVGKALAKIPADRFATAGEFAQALHDPGYTFGHTEQEPPARGVRSPSRSRWRLGLVGLLVLGGVLAGWWLRGSTAEPDRVVARFRIPVESERGLTGAPVNTLALSPDGRTIVYVGRSGGAGQLLYRRRLDELAAHPITGTEGASFPIFSPSGDRIAYFGPGGMYVIATDGGSPSPLPNVPSQALAQAIWLDEDNVIATGGAGGLLRVGLDGATETIAVPDPARGESFLGVNAVLPDARTLLVIAATGTGVNGPVYAVDAYTGARTPIIETVTNAVWYSEGFLLLAQPTGALHGVAFDAEAKRVVGATVTIAEGVRQAIGGPAQVAVSGTGSMVYIPEQPFNLMLVDRRGNRELVAEGHRFHSPRFSPDGRFLAVDFTQQGSRDVWALDLAQGTMARITFENDGHDPTWAPDGRSIYYISQVGVFRRSADGSGVAESIYVVGNTPTGVVDITRDGTLALTAPTGANGAWDIGMLPLGAERQEERLLASPFNEQQPALSPDGRWLAYTSDETGRDEIYVRPFPEGGAKVLVSASGGTEARWRPDGRELYYIGQRNNLPYLMAAMVTTTPRFSVVDRVPLFDVSEFEPSSPHANYDLSPDGRRFAMVHQGPLSEMVFVMNWTEEIRRRGGGGE